MFRRSIAAYRVLTSKQAVPVGVDAAICYLATPSEEISDFRPTDLMGIGDLPKKMWWNGKLVPYVSNDMAVKIDGSTIMLKLERLYFLFDLLLPVIALVLTLLVLKGWYVYFSMMCFTLLFWIRIYDILDESVILRRKAVYAECGLDFGGWPKPKVE